MKVYLDGGGDKRPIGGADVQGDYGPVFEVPMFRAASTIAEAFTIGTVTHRPAGGGPVVERAVLAAPGQLLELLPGWPLVS